MKKEVGGTMMVVRPVPSRSSTTSTGAEEEGAVVAAGAISMSPTPNAPTPVRTTTRSATTTPTTKGQEHEKDDDMRHEKNDRTTITTRIRRKETQQGADNNNKNDDDNRPPEDEDDDYVGPPRDENEVHESDRETYIEYTIPIRMDGPAIPSQQQEQHPSSSLGGGATSATGIRHQQKDVLGVGVGGVVVGGESCDNSSNFFLSEPSLSDDSSSLSGAAAGTGRIRAPHRMVPRPIRRIRQQQLQQLPLGSSPPSWWGGDDRSIFSGRQQHPPPLVVTNGERGGPMPPPPPPPPCSTPAPAGAEGGTAGSSSGLQPSSPGNTSLSSWDNSPAVTQRVLLQFSSEDGSAAGATGSGTTGTGDGGDSRHQQQQQNSNTTYNGGRRRNGGYHPRHAGRGGRGQTATATRTQSSQQSSPSPSPPTTNTTTTSSVEKQHQQQEQQEQIEDTKQSAAIDPATDEGNPAMVRMTSSVQRQATPEPRPQQPLDQTNHDDNNATRVRAGGVEQRTYTPNSLGSNKSSAQDEVDAKKAGDNDNVLPTNGGKTKSTEGKHRRIRNGEVKDMSTNGKNEFNNDDDDDEIPTPTTTTAATMTTTTASISPAAVAAVAMSAAVPTTAPPTCSISSESESETDSMSVREIAAGASADPFLKNLRDQAMLHDSLLMRSTSSFEGSSSSFYHQGGSSSFYLRQQHHQQSTTPSTAHGEMQQHYHHPATSQYQYLAYHQRRRRRNNTSTNNGNGLHTGAAGTIPASFAQRRELDMSFSESEEEDEEGKGKDYENWRRIGATAGDAGAGAIADDMSFSHGPLDWEVADGNPANNNTKKDHHHRVATTAATGDAAPANGKVDQHPNNHHYNHNRHHHPRHRRNRSSASGDGGRATMTTTTMTDGKSFRDGGVIEQREETSPTTPFGAVSGRKTRGDAVAASWVTGGHDWKGMAMDRIPMPESSADEEEEEDVAVSRRPSVPPPPSRNLLSAGRVDPSSKFTRRSWQRQHGNKVGAGGGLAANEQHMSGGQASSPYGSDSSLGGRERYKQERGRMATPYLHHHRPPPLEVRHPSHAVGIESLQSLEEDDDENDIDIDYDDFNSAEYSAEYTPDDDDDDERPVSIHQNRLNFAPPTVDGLREAEQHAEDRTKRRSSQKVLRSRPSLISRVSPFAEYGTVSGDRMQREAFFPVSSVIESDPQKYPTYVCPGCKTRQREFFTMKDAPPSQLEGPSGYLALYFAIYVIASLFIFGLEEGWEPLDCIYFAVITLTTAGLGDFKPTTDANKIVCSIFIYFGVACIGLLLGSYIAGMLDDRVHSDRKAKMVDSCPNCARIKTLKGAAERRKSTAQNDVEHGRPPSCPQRKYSSSERSSESRQETRRAAGRNRRGSDCSATDTSSNSRGGGGGGGAGGSGRELFPEGSQHSQQDPEVGFSVGVGGPSDPISSPVVSVAKLNLTLGSPVTRQILGRQSHTRHTSLDMGGSMFASAAEPKTLPRRSMRRSQSRGGSLGSSINLTKNSAPQTPTIRENVALDSITGGNTENYQSSTDDDNVSQASSETSDTATLDETSVRIKNAKYVFLTLREALLNSMVIIAVGCLGFWLIEGFSLVDSWYFTTVLLTTVGYGDIAPVTNGGKLFATVYILVAGTILLNNMSMISMIPLELRKRRIERAVLHQFGDQLDDAALRELATGPVIQRLNMSTQSSNGLVECTREMFSLAMLVRLGKVKEEDILDAFAAFHRLDANREGVLNSKSIIAGMIQKRKATHPIHTAVPMHSQPEQQQQGQQQPLLPPPPLLHEESIQAQILRQQQQETDQLMAPFWFDESRGESPHGGAIHFDDSINLDSTGTLQRGSFEHTEFSNHDERSALLHHQQRMVMPQTQQVPLDNYGHFHQSLPLLPWVVQQQHQHLSTPRSSDGGDSFYEGFGTPIAGNKKRRRRMTLPSPERGNPV